jgi:hypothetical protein
MSLSFQEQLCHDLGRLDCWSIAKSTEGEGDKQHARGGVVEHQQRVCRGKERGALVAQGLGVQVERALVADAHMQRGVLRIEYLAHGHICTTADACLSRLHACSNLLNSSRASLPRHTLPPQLQSPQQRVPSMQTGTVAAARTCGLH